MTRRLRESLQRSIASKRAHGDRAIGRSERRQPDDREDIPDGQVRARMPADAVHRLQRPAVHGERRRGEQEGLWHRPRHQSLGRHDRHRSHLGCRLERRRVRADHDELPLAGARTRRQDHHAGSANHAARPHVRSLPAGQARTRCGALCRRAAPHDQARLARPRLHRHFTRSASTRSPHTAPRGRLRKPQSVVGRAGALNSAGR